MAGGQLASRQLGSLSVSAMGLGCMGITAFMGPALSEDNTYQLIKAAVEAGITLFDSADCYGADGANEKLLGKVLKRLIDEGVTTREQLQIVSKFAVVVKDGQFGFDISPEYIDKAIDSSLANLGLDYIDLYFVHRIPHKDADLAACMRKLSALQKRGKIRHVGLSMPTAEQIRQAHAICKLAAVQNEFSLFTQDPLTNGVLAVCKDLGIGFMPYSPLCRGLLTGKVNMEALKKEAASEGQLDVRVGMTRFEGDHFTRNTALVDKLKPMASKKDCTLAQLALAWLMAQYDQVVPIPGTTKIERLQENLGACDVLLSQTELQEINRLISPDQVSGGRYSPRPEAV